MLFAFSMLALTTNAVAYEYNGRIVTGAYQSKEAYKESSAGSETNDSQAVLGRAYFDMTGIGPLRNEFVVDYRDKYDFFGVLDREHLTLVPGNEPQLRQLAVKYPFEQGSVAWSMGRFAVSDAGVPVNDGADFGLRVTPIWKLGAFAGLVPDSRSGQTFRPNADDSQGGIYSVYQSRPSPDWDDHTYIANGLIIEQIKDRIGHLNDPNTTTSVTPDPPLDTGDEDLLETRQTTRWYSNAVYQPNRDTRITELAALYLTPKAYLRNGYVSGFRRLHRAATGTASLLRLDLTEYAKNRDIRDKLAPSVYTQGEVKGDVTLKTDLQLLANAKYGTRAVDGLNKAEVFGGLQSSRLASGHMAASAKIGYRKNFVSKDTFARAALDYYGSRIEANITQDVINEAREGGKTLHPLVTDATISYLVSRELIGSLGIEYAKDEEVTVTSGLLTLAYRFGSKLLTPVRTSAPPAERF